MEDAMEDKLTRPLNIPKIDLIVCKVPSGSRIIAKLIDTGIDAILLIALVSIFLNRININNLNESANILTILLVIYQVISLFLNLIVPVLTKGQTLGKMAMSIRIIHMDGNPGNIIVYLIRQSFFTVIALIGQINGLENIVQGVLIIIYLILLIGISTDEYGRTIQDKFARTMVVNDEAYKKYREKAFEEIDHPTPLFDESNSEETLEGETMPDEGHKTFNQSINDEEEIL